MVFSKLSLAAAVTLLLSVASAHPGALDVNKRHEAYLQKLRAIKALERQQPTRVEARQNNGVPPVDQITSGMPTATPSTVFTTFAAGATPTVKGASPLPSINIVASKYPALDVIPPTDGPEIQADMAKMRAANIPNIPKTADGSCDSSPQAVANATDKGICWWTCGGCLRPTDIAVCPDKNTWGVTYDDGPSDYTANLINFLNTKNLQATFFVVGSRVISRPALLQTEYMLGHEISVHTWSHPPLTSLTNEQIVAELSWTKKAIKDVIGVTPLTFRPPYGDIDDRVRAVAKALGLTPIMWTGSGEDEFDTDDWKIPGGTANGTSSLAAFTSILSKAQNLNTGFIVLEHDLYQQTVDMALGYFLPLAEQKQLTLKSVHSCLNQPLELSYVETSNNAASYGGGSSGGNSTSTGSSGNSTSHGTSSSGSKSPSGSASLSPSGTNKSASGQVQGSSAAGGKVSMNGGALMASSAVMLLGAVAGAMML